MCYSSHLIFDVSVFSVGFLFSFVVVAADWINNNKKIIIIMAVIVHVIQKCCSCIQL